METKTRFLGKKPWEPDTRDLLLKDYIDKPTLVEVAQVPGALDWGAFADVAPDTDPLYNQKAGCCVLSAPGHQVKMVGQVTGAPVLVTEQMVRDAYSALTGYDPVTGANDNGANIRDMLNWWRQKGLYGTTIAAYCAVNWRDADEIAIAAWLCGGLIGGYNLPIASQGQNDENGNPEWSIPAGGWPANQGPGTWGGHCIYQHGTSPGLDEANSWGEPTVWTPGWRADCCEELWAPLLSLWVLRTGRAPNGFAWADLLRDVEARGQ